MYAQRLGVLIEVCYVVYVVHAPNTLSRAIDDRPLQTYAKRIYSVCKHFKYLKRSSSVRVLNDRSSLLCFENVL